MKFHARQLISIGVSVFIILSLISTGFITSAQTSVLNVVQDGNSVDWVNTQNMVKPGVKDILKDKSVCRVSPQKTDRGVIWLDCTDLSDIGVMASQIKSISFYINNPMNTSFALAFQYQNSSSTIGLGDGNYYLLNKADFTAVACRQNNGQVIIPSGFDGYVVYSLETFDSAKVAEFLNCDFGSMTFAVMNTSDMLGKCWYYGDISVSDSSAEDILNAYTENAVSYLINDGSIAGAVAGMDAGLIREVSNDVSLSGTSYSFTNTGTDGAWSCYYLYNSACLNENYAIQTNAMLASQEAISFWISVPANESKLISLRFGSDGHSYRGSYTTFNTKNGEIKTNPTGDITLSDFEGYVLVPLTGSDIISYSWGSSLKSWGDFVSAENCFERLGFCCNVSSDSKWYMDNVCLISDLTKYQAYLTSKVLTDTAETRLTINDGSNTQTLWGYGGMSFTTVDGVSPAGKAFKCVQDAGDNNWPAYIIDSAAAISGEELQQQDAIAFWLKVPSGQNKFIEFAMNGTSYPVTSMKTFDTNTGVLAQYGSNVTLNGFEGYVFLSIPSGLKQSGSFENLRAANIRYSGETVTYYFDDFKFIKDEESYISDLKASHDAFKNIINNGSSISTIDAADMGSYWDSEIVENVSPSGDAYYLTLKSGRGNWPVYYIKSTSSMAANEIAAQEAISMWVKVPEGSTKKIAIRVNNGGVYSGTITVFNTLTGTVSTVANEVDLDGGFEGYVVASLVDGKVGGTAWADYAAADGLSQIGFCCNANLGYDISWYIDELEYIDNLKERIDAFKASADEMRKVIVNGNSAAALVNGDNRIKAETVESISPSGTALKITESGINNWPVFCFGSSSTLTSEELKSQQAISIWFDVPEGQSKFISPKFNYSEFGYGGNIITVNTVNGQVNRYNGDFTLTDFRGYMIIPLQNVTIGNTVWSDFITQNGFFQLGFCCWAESSVYYYMDDIKFVDNLSAYLTDLDVSALDGDVNDDGSINIKDLVRFKKYFAENNISIAYQNTDLAKDKSTDVSDLTMLKKLLVGFNITDVASAANSNIGMGIFHSTVGDWNYAYGNAYANENEFVNNYITSDLYEISQVKANGGVAWLQVANTFSSEGITAFASRESATLSREWKQVIANKVSNIKNCGLWGAVAGFFTEEMCASISADQFEIMTAYLKNTYADKRIFACLSITEITGGTSVPSGNVIEAADEQTYQYVTDIGYNLYTPADYDAYNSMIEQMKTQIGRSDIKIWMFPCVYGADRTQEYLLNHLNMCYDLLKAQSNPGGLMLYNWRTFYDESGSVTEMGLDKLIAEKGYTLLANRIIEIGSELIKLSSKITQ